ncbi:MAG: disulfide bond formation protein B [Nitratireductor sp.]|nr:disulfide bond formation protein B [Nitratireductor sp.]
MFDRESGKMQKWLSVLLLAGMVAVIGTALGFEHIGGYTPCKLCLGQRQPYYAAIPLVALGAVSALLNWPGFVTRGLLAVGGLLMVYTGILGVEHAAIEWGFLPSPGDCGGGGTVTDAGNLLGDLTRVKPPSCDEAAGRFLGLSFAGWNVVAALILTAIAFKGAFGKAR